MGLNVVATGNFLTRFLRATVLRPFARLTTAPRTPDGNRYVLLGPNRTGGVWVTEETALQVSALFACISVISKALTSSRWEVFTETPDGNRTMRRDDPLWRLLNVRPNPEANAYSFRDALIWMALLWGNGYAEIERDGTGRPVALWLLHPDRVTLRRDADGRLLYEVSNQAGGPTFLSVRDMFHLKGPGIDGLMGYQIAMLAARSIGHALAAETFGSSFFANGTQMGGVLEADQPVGDDVKKSLVTALNERHQGPANAHKFLILDGGLKWKSMSTTPEDAQFIETRHLSIEEICRWFGVPPHKIAHLLRATNNNIEHQGLEFVRDALTPWAERMAQEADWKLLPENNRSLKTRFDLDWHSDGDAKSRAEADGSLVNNGIINRNEARRRRGLNTIGEDGEKFTVQLAMTTLDRIGKNEIALPDNPDDDDAPGNDAAPADIVDIRQRLKGYLDAA